MPRRLRQSNDSMMIVEPCSIWPFSDCFKHVTRVKVCFPLWILRFRGLESSYLIESNYSCAGTVQASSVWRLYGVALFLLLWWESYVGMLLPFCFITTSVTYERVSILLLCSNVTMQFGSKPLFEKIFPSNLAAATVTAWLARTVAVNPLLWKFWRRPRTDAGNVPSI